MLHNHTLNSLGSVPLSAAPLAVDYPQFHSVAIPPESGAIAAWEGYIRPFIDDDSARAYLRIAEADGTVQVSEGMIIVSDAQYLPVHWAEPLLVRMNRLCKVLILQMPEPGHPRAYLLEPLYSSSVLSYHPHPRGDLAITIGSRRVEGLCVYSAAEFEYNTANDKFVQFLDVVTTHVARHLIWLKTRRLFEVSNGSLHILRTPRPGEFILDEEVGIPNAVIACKQIPPRRFWNGYWPGKNARYAGASGHFNNLSPRDQCWCGSGLMYGDCHRTLEGSML